MKKQFYLQTAAFLVFFQLFACAKSEKENMQKENSINPPERIAVGAVSVAYLLNSFENRNVIAVPSTKRKLPEAYSELEKIGHPENPNTEKIQSLNPDFYISVTSLKNHTAAAIESIGVKTLYLNLYTYEDCLNSILELGNILNEKEKAIALKEKIKAQAETILAKTKNLKSPKVLLLMGIPPKMQAATCRSYAGSLLQALSVQNISDEIYKTDKPYYSFGMEDILKNSPQIILIITHKNDKNISASVKNFFENDDIWKNVEAVKTGRIHVLDPFVFTVNKGEGIITAFEILKEIIYGKDVEVN